MCIRDRPGHQGQGVVVHQTVAGKVEVLGAGQLGENQPGEQRGLVGEGHAGEVQISSVVSTKLSRNI